MSVIENKGKLRGMLGPIAPLGPTTPASPTAADVSVRDMSAKIELLPGHRGEPAPRVEVSWTSTNDAFRHLHEPKRGGSLTDAYSINLDDVAEMAEQYMTDAQIAAYLKIPKQVFLDLLAQSPELVIVLDYQRSKLIRAATGIIKHEIDNGEKDAAKFVLERKGGWRLPKETETIVIQPAGPVFDGGHVRELAERQRALLAAPDAEMDS